MHSSGELYSYTFNGGRNAGHEIYIDGQAIAFHQLPVAVAQEGATAIIGKGRVIHPQDLVTEMEYAKARLGGQLPCKRLIIDIHATISDDLHAAFEQYTNGLLSVGKGSTKSGIAQGYASYYEKRAMTIEDLMAEDWDHRFANNYRFYATLLGGREQLAAVTVNRLTVDGKRTQKEVGDLEEYLWELEEVRKKIASYVADTRPIIENIWYHTTIPFTVEAGQGAGLDPYYGIYPDVTASRPLVRIGISDSTEAVIRAEQISLKVGVAKVPYMTSVGSRTHPYDMDSDIAEMYRIEQDEFGRSTGRKRGVYPIDLVAMRALHEAVGYSHVVLTHMDAPHGDIPIEVVVNYRDKETNEVVPYRPYQTHWDQVYGEVIRLPSWDGKTVASMRSVEELPEAARQFIALINQTVAPVALVTNGRELGDAISFLP